MYAVVHKEEIAEDYKRKLKVFFEQRAGAGEWYGLDGLALDEASIRAITA